MRIGISGANGHIGNNLARTLADQGFDLRLMVNKRKEALDCVYGDIHTVNLLDPHGVAAFAEGLDVFIHLAARISIDGDPTGIVSRTNIEGTRNVVDACLKAGVKRLIHFSSIHAFDPFPLEGVLDENRPLRPVDATPYDQSKIESERIAFAAIPKGLEVIVLAPTSVYGINDYGPSLLGQAIRDIYKGQIPALIPGGYDFVFVEDVVAGTIAAIEKGRTGEKYLLAGTYHSIRELSATIGKVSGRSTRQFTLPFSLLRVLIPVFKLQSKLTGKRPLFTKEALKALLESPKQISSQKAANELNYQITPFETGIRRTVEWFQKHS